MDLPADEEREEVILQYLQPHPNLEKLHMDGYGGSKFPKWVGNPFSFAALQEIKITNCEEISSLPLYIHSDIGKLDALEQPQSMLKRVYIDNCWQLTSIAGLHNLHSLKDLTIYDCPQLQLLSKEGLPFKLEKLHIEHCQRLTLVSGMQNLTSLKALIIRHCPKFEITAEVQHSSMPNKIEIVNCPGMGHWCHIQKFNYIQIATRNKLIISNTWKNIKPVFNQFHAATLVFNKSWTFLQQENLISELQQLTIWSCMDIPHIGCLPGLSFLQTLVIKDCPTIQLLSNEMLPSMLRSLEVDSCENLRSVQLVDILTSLETLVIRDCPRIQLLPNEMLPSTLRSLEVDSCENLRSARLDILTSLETLVITDCPRIQLLPNEMLPSTLRSLVVLGCENLRSVQWGLQEGPYALDVLRIMNYRTSSSVTVWSGFSFQRQVRMQRTSESNDISALQESIRRIDI